MAEMAETACRRHLSQNRSRQMQDIVDCEDQYVEKVAAQQIFDGHIYSTQAQGSYGDHQFRRGCHESNKQGADEALFPVHLQRQRSPPRQPHARSHNNPGGDQVSVECAPKAEARKAI